MIEKYYNERMFCEGMPKFKDLNDGQKKKIEKSAVYGFYQLNIRASEFVKAVQKATPTIDDCCNTFLEFFKRIKIYK